MQFSPAASRPRENGYDGIHRSPVECWPREKRQRIPTRFVILCARTVTVKVASCHLLIGRSARSDADRALPVSHDLQKQEVALCCLAELRIGNVDPSSQGHGDERSRSGALKFGFSNKVQHAHHGYGLNSVEPT